MYLEGETRDGGRGRLEGRTGVHQDERGVSEGADRHKEQRRVGTTGPKTNTDNTHTCTTILTPGLNNKYGPEGGGPDRGGVVVYGVLPSLGQHRRDDTVVHIRL